MQEINQYSSCCGCLCRSDMDDEDTVNDSISSLLICPYMLSLPLSLSSNANISAGTERSCSLVPSIFNVDSGGVDSGAGRLI